MLTVSRLDGSFGLSGLGASLSPISGALAGLAKTAGREWPSVNCKAIDVDAAFDVPEGVSRVIVEEFLKRGPSEVGLTRQGRTVVELEADSTGGETAATGREPGAGRRARGQWRRPGHHGGGGRRAGDGVSAAAGLAGPIAGAGP